MLLMKKIVIFAGLGVLTLLASCGKGSAENVDLVGQWSIRSYNPVEMSSYSLVETDRDYRFEFDGDGAFYCGTDCNSISGTFTVIGDSLRFDNMAATEMACENETLERAMKSALPAVRTVELISDSVLSLKEDHGNVVVELVRVK